MSTSHLWPLLLIVLAVLMGVAGSVLRHRRTPLRAALPAVLQVLAGGALWWLLHPPLQPVAPVHAHLLMDAQASVPTPADGPLYALPEAGDASGAQRVPDLASLLRRQPQITALTLHGTALPARDRQPQAVALQHTPAIASGLTAVHHPAYAAAGNPLPITATLAAGFDPQWQLELRDPADRLLDRQQPDAGGRAQLQAALRDAGQVVFQLRVLDGQARLIDSAPVAVQVVDAPALRLHQLSGAPNAETKFIQRWALDAGLNATRQLPTGAGVVLGDVGSSVDARTLARSDLLLLDERSLLALGSGGRTRIHSALRDGLGVLVQPLDGLQPSHRQALAELGLRVSGGNRNSEQALENGKRSPEQLDVLRGPRAHSTPQAEAAPRTQAWNINSDSAAALLLDQHTRIGVWQQLGRGRIGLLAVPDTHLLVLGGRDDLHAQLWASASSLIARAQDSTEDKLQLPAWLWQHERNRVCGLQADLEVIHNDSQQSQHLRIDPATPGCAAWWPQHSGWHRIGNQAVFVTAPDQAPGLHRAERLRETADTVAASALPDDHALPQQPGPRWPWWLALVGLLGVTWWVERRND